MLETQVVLQLQLVGMCAQGIKLYADMDVLVGMDVLGTHDCREQSGAVLGMAREGMVGWETLVQRGMWLSAQVEQVQVAAVDVGLGKALGKVYFVLHAMGHMSAEL